MKRICLVLLTVIVLGSAGCATPGINVTSGSDNATAVSSSNLLPYVKLAAQEALAAATVYATTQDATTLEKQTYWLEYGLGVIDKIEALSAAN